MARKEKRALRTIARVTCHATRFQAPMRMGVKQ
jgi:hypothetical protein